MDRAEADGPGLPDAVPPNPAPAASRAPKILIQGAACLALLPLLAFVGTSGRELWGEWRSLRGDERSARVGAVVGYKNITLDLSYAKEPADWFHDQGEHTMIWAGWKDNAHRWFRVDRGDVARDHLSFPIGRDTIRAIDVPIYEGDGDATWLKVPDEADVAGLTLGDDARVYPITVMDKVVVVNDTIAGRPILVGYGRAPRRGRVVTAYEANLDGRRVSMGTSGYFLDGNPMLYDRGTESLWVAREGGLVAIGGSLKGTTLRRIALAEPAAWGDWRARHPTSRLLVGALRPRPSPVD